MQALEGYLPDLGKKIPLSLLMSQFTDPSQSTVSPEDPTASSRKKDHIELAFRSQTGKESLDDRFYYEPLLAAHPEPGSYPPVPFSGKMLRTPMWVSSMTGGTEWAGTINHNLARACRDFGMGMGLGSCRGLLFSDETFPDFDVRTIIGPDQPLFANLGIAQLEELLEQGELDRVNRLIDKLRADGLIIHVNPLQEWLQPEGDRFKRAPLDTIVDVLESVEYPIMVKEVGQGMGRRSLKALLALPLAAVDFGAHGGTNFALLELLRNTEQALENYGPLAHIGHQADEMIELTNEIVVELGATLRCRQLIVSGGIKNFLDGYCAIEKVNLPAIFGMASAFLKHARGNYDDLAEFVDLQVKGLELARAFLELKTR